MICGLLMFSFLRLSSRVEWIFVGIHHSEAHDPSPDGTHRPRHMLFSICEPQEDSSRSPNHFDNCHGVLLYTPVRHWPVLEPGQQRQRVDVQAEFRVDIGGVTGSRTRYTWKGGIRWRCNLYVGTNLAPPPA